ncbi:GntR family transcriptional regulator [Streptomyces sp. NPDC101455]|uniref:GntR family transcriptional regulator n=1 Tax=Streptomyces sp. NPDC101455 TaxID=3366142 RepID=UPI003804FD38
MTGTDGATAAGIPAPLETVSAVDALVAALTERVLSAELRPGDRMRESALARDYQVARHTLRAALSRLTSSGLLSYQTNRGWSVAEVTPEEFSDLTFLRVALEVQAMRELAVRGEKVGAPARALLRRLLDEGEGVTWAERLRIDMELHRALVDQAGSRRISEIYRGVQLSLQLYFVARVDWFESMREDEFQDLHAELCDVIDGGDPELVERHLRRQLDYRIPD